MIYPTLPQLHTEFMAECRYSARLSSATLKNYQDAFSLLTKVVPTVSLETITTETLTNFFQELETRKRMVGHGRLKEGVKASTIITYRNKLNPFFKWLKEKNYLSVLPFENVPYPTFVYDEPKYLCKAQIEKIITAVSFSISWSSPFIQKRNLAIITVLLYTGLRKSELLNIKVDDVDLSRAELKVAAATSKSKDFKTLPLNPEVRRRLTEYLEERTRVGCTTLYLFASENKIEPFTEHGLKRLTSRISAASGVKFHVHQLRHTFAVNLINSGSDVSVVQSLMGHKSTTSTLTYLRCIPNKTLRRSVESLSWNNLI